MCLVVCSWQQHPEYPLIFAGNRDEFHQRPTTDAEWWSDPADIVGGRDLQAGGTWLALHRNGRFATVTNFRDAQPVSAKKRSRGHLVTDFLLSDKAPLRYLATINGEQYAGFNLLVCDGATLAYLSNRDGAPRSLPGGLYGLSNASLDSPWHKVERSKRKLQHLLDDDAVNETELFRLLNDREKAPADSVDSGPLSFTAAHAYSAPFIVAEPYGTRSSSVVLRDRAGQWQFRERRFDANGKTQGQSAFRIGACDDA